ncbi:hypothetical protein [Devosia sp.]|uniref:hypothetical protein n=1 Tax=Devosia sp. TaxID=1871048 RepID=UPI002735DE49|nr:hypothetical protein [Devosia sp.]MDP2779777.1 hypothetical protein [Devosia sp.]
MEARINDFTTLFNMLWYRDFPVVLGSIEFAKRADWTTHIASTVRQVASISGLFSCFESGGRTDAELQFADRSVWAKLEWEWDEPRQDNVREITKLAGAAYACEFCVYIGYSQTKYLDDNLAKIVAEWAGVPKPLLVILVTFDLEGEWRYFDRLQTYRIDTIGAELVRDQPALPWCVPNSRWQSLGSLEG